MSIYTETTIETITFQEHTLQATFYEPMDLKAAILYFHGGGFVFGSRTDLPQTYIDLFAEEGIGVVAVDYPLAPETKLAAILDTSYEMTEWFVKDFLPAHELTDYFIMGRSAGSFLALANGVYTEQLAVRPKGIISLYGYYNLNDASFTVPNRYYLKYPKVSDKVVAAQIQNEPIFQSTDQNRYFLYMAARQKGDWMNMFLGSPQDKRELSLSKEEVKQLPPLFLASSTKDPDVPARQSRQMANMHSDATLHLVDVEEHDFDRTHVDTLGIELYKKIIDWMLALIE